jgi:hypothetical protein
MSQANVYTSLSNAIWYTDKCEINTGNSAVTYQVYATALGSVPAQGNIYSEPSSVDPYSSKQIYVGVGNYLTVTGTGFTAQELGTASSAQAGVFDGTENLTPPAPADGSAQFNGSNYLSVAGGVGTAMGTGDFTWECWVYPTSSSDYQCFIDTRTNPLEGGDNTGFFFGTNFNTLAPIYYTDGLQLASTESITLNAWNHVALTRNSGTVTLWVNGASGGTQSNTTDLTQQRVLIGGDGLGAALNLTGNISNLRMVKGVAVYTVPFTPSATSLTATQAANVNGNPSSAITGTQTSLLLNTYYGLSYLTDGSVNNFTVTNNGSVASDALNPF